jgi:hypothetical protein
VKLADYAVRTCPNPNTLVITPIFNFVSFPQRLVAKSFGGSWLRSLRGILSRVTAGSGSGYGLKRMTLPNGASGSLSGGGEGSTVVNGRHSMDGMSSGVQGVNGVGKGELGGMSFIRRC